MIVRTCESFVGVCEVWRPLTYLLLPPRLFLTVTALHNFHTLQRFDCSFSRLIGVIVRICGSCVRFGASWDLKGMEDLRVR